MSDAGKRLIKAAKDATMSETKAIGFTKFMVPGGEGVEAHPAGLLYKRDEVDPVVRSILDRLKASEEREREALAAKEAAEAREREAVMQSLASLGQAQDAHEAQQAAEAEAAALRDRMEAIVREYPVAAGMAKMIDPEEQGYGSIRAAAEFLATLDQPKEGGDNE